MDAPMIAICNCGKPIPESADRMLFECRQCRRPKIKARRAAH